MEIPTGSGSIPSSVATYPFAACSHVVANTTSALPRSSVIQGPCRLVSRTTSSDSGRSARPVTNGESGTSRAGISIGTTTRVVDTSSDLPKRGCWKNSYMTVGPLFTTSAINIARAAVRRAEHSIASDAPVGIRVDSYGPDGSRRLYVEVSSDTSDGRRINVDDSTIDACLAEPDYETAHRLVRALVERLADEIKMVVRAQLSSHGEGLPDAPLS